MRIKNKKKYNPVFITLSYEIVDEKNFKILDRVKNVPLNEGFQRFKGIMCEGFQMGDMNDRKKHRTSKQSDS